MNLVISQKKTFFNLGNIPVTNEIKALSTIPPKAKD